MASPSAMAAREDGDEQHELPSFGERLEERARGLASARSRLHDHFSVTSLIEDEIALTLDQLDGTRARWEEIGRDLVQTECYIETELMQMEQRTPRYSPYRYPEREKLQRRLMGIAQERRRLMVSFGHRIDELHDRLLSLWQQHRQLESM